MSTYEASPVTAASEMAPRMQEHQPEEKPSPDSFRVMSFNVAADLAPAAKIIEAIRYEQPDVVGLQELGERLADEIHQQLHNEYPWWALHPASGYQGKGILSRFPLQEVAHLHAAPGRPDMQANVVVGGALMTVIVAHPRPPTVSLRGANFDSVTAAQIDLIKEVALAGGPSLILGDFNMTPRHRNYARFTASGLIDAFEESGGSGATLPARVGNTGKVSERWRQVRLRPVLRVDYIWYTRHLRAASSWVGQDGGSDHLPVVAEMIWRAAHEE